VDALDSDEEEEKPTRKMPKRRKVGEGREGQGELVAAIKELTAAVEEMSGEMKRVIRSEGRMARKWRFTLLTELFHLGRVMEGLEEGPWRPLTVSLADVEADVEQAVAAEEAEDNGMSSESSTGEEDKVMGGSDEEKDSSDSENRPV
jgi:hypothetical protein